MDTKKNNHGNKYVQLMVKINVYKNNDKIWLQEYTK